jgi:hypothetical protein
MSSAIYQSRSDDPRMVAAIAQMKVRRDATTDVEKRQEIGRQIDLLEDGLIIYHLLHGPNPPSEEEYLTKYYAGLEDGTE